MATNGGGIIPFSIYNGRIFLLLGREDCYDRTWSECGKYSDFGGSRDDEEENLEAIAREAYEESFGLLGPYESLLELIQKEEFSYKIVLGRSEFFFIHIPYVFFIDKIFHNMLRCSYIMVETLGLKDKLKYDDELVKGESDKYLMHHGFYEKDKIKYFALEQVLTEIFDNEKRKKYRECFIRLMKKFYRSKELISGILMDLKVWKFNVDSDKLLHPIMNEITVDEEESVGI